MSSARSAFVQLPFFIRTHTLLPPFSFSRMPASPVLGSAGRRGPRLSAPERRRPRRPRSSSRKRWIGSWCLVWGRFLSLRGGHEGRVYGGIRAVGTGKTTDERAVVGTVGRGESGCGARASGAIQKRLEPLREIVRERGPRLSPSEVADARAPARLPRCLASGRRPARLSSARSAAASSSSGRDDPESSESPRGPPGSGHRP